MFQITTICRLRINTDGEGIRSLVVTHGCPLRCRYCINPETWNGHMRGMAMTASELYDELSLDRPYLIATNGGVTFGGGEPLQYAKDIQGFKALSGDDYTLFAETSLNVPKENVRIAASCIDRFYVDIKTMDAVSYQKYTGGKLERALQNLKVLLNLTGPERIVVRIPRIPDYTFEEDQWRDQKRLSAMGIEKFDLFTYYRNKK